MALVAGMMWIAAGNPVLAGDADYKGFYISLDAAITQPNSLDHHYANHVVFSTTPETMELLVLDDDSDFTGKLTFGYGFGEMGKLQISWWGFDNEDSLDNTLVGGVYPTIFGYGMSDGLYPYNSTYGVKFSTSAKVQADTLDIDYIRSFEPGKKVTIGLLAGLRIASWEEDQSFEADEDSVYYPGTDYTQGKHFESDAIGMKLGTNLEWGFTEHFALVGSAVWSFMQADTEGESFSTSGTPSDPPDDVFSAEDNNIRAEIRDYDLRAQWEYDKFEWWVGYQVSTWEGMVTDPLTQNEGGHFAIGPASNRGRDNIAFNSLHAGVTFKFGGGK